MTAAEAEKVISQPDISTTLGLRDRAILELLYSTGVRRQELVGLHLRDLDIERRHLMVRHGKGKKDRLLPVSERAMAWVEKYLEEARPRLVLAHDEGVLFLGRYGMALTKQWLTCAVRRYVVASGIKKSGSCHIFRHTLATLMLENGADIRHVQLMLGHAQLTTTQIYTHVSIKALQEVHKRTHPGSRLRRDRSDDDDQGSSLELLDQALEDEALEEQAEDS
jgi:integrase/recombinase XerD